ncbi:VanZ family protein [Pelagibacteraceae bacterium]|nr:VanZ family protein [Pelagibacteraceae bacterium]
MDQKKFIVFFKITFFIWLFFIFIISVYPGNLIGLFLKGDPTTYPGGDKISHFISYLGLSILGVLSLDFKKKGMVIIIFLTLFSIIMEVVHLYIPNRYYENLDLVMNILGTYCGLVFLYLKRFKLFT